MGEHLTSQYRAAVSGMAEYIAFGAMVLNIEDMITVSARGHGGRFGDRDTGLKAWLKQFAPDVGRSVAYRCREIAEGIKAEFQLGARTDLYQLLKGSKLDEKDEFRRQKILAFVEGKSQRQLLFYFGKPDAQIGGKRVATEKLTAEQRREMWIEGARANAIQVFSGLHEIDEKWKLLNDDQLKLALENSKKLTKQMEKWLETPPPSRPQLQAEKYVQLEEVKS